MISGVGFSPLPSRTLGDRHTKWLGYGLGSNGTFQFFEGENMKAREYDPFLDDLTDFTVCTFLPRAYSEFESLAELPRMPMMPLGCRAPGNIRVLAELVWQSGQRMPCEEKRIRAATPVEGRCPREVCLGCNRSGFGGLGT